MPKPTRRTIPDHPRACGANEASDLAEAASDGSSPRVRGKHDCQTSRRSGYRIIPARAGQTRRGVRVSSTSPDHPRACGANSCSLSRLSSTSGSSPRVRGKLRSRYRHAICYRIIPARAGQTLAGSEGGTTASDHPRACGANAIVIRRSDTPPGSSPRVRGKPGGLEAVDVRPRIIPARAGQTRWPGSRRCAPTDHPRACGANISPATATRRASGSSPRVRGKRGWLKDGREIRRIIPARAGQTSWRSLRISRRPDHPRACGANSSSRPQTSSSPGSSPRVRGKRCFRIRCGFIPRIIPARAGQTG